MFLHSLNQQLQFGSNSKPMYSAYRLKAKGLCDVSVLQIIFKSFLQTCFVDLSCTEKYAFEHGELVNIVKQESLACIWKEQKLILVREHILIYQQREWI